MEKDGKYKKRKTTQIQAERIKSVWVQLGYTVTIIGEV